MVFIFASKAGTGFHASLWTFPAAIAYSTLGIAALSYNAFGMDAAGIQFYFLAPVRLRTVLLAKNLFTFAISAFEVLIVFVVLSYIAVTAGRRNHRGDGLLAHLRHPLQRHHRQHAFHHRSQEDGSRQALTEASLAA